jgi:hypothetical protein
MVSSDKDYVRISWLPNYDGGDDIDDYEVEWKIETNDLFNTFKSSNNLLAFTVDGLQVGRLYHFRVRARNDVGLSLPSATAIFMAARVPN